ncbi:MAG TPA: hypothetical protein VGF40_19640 [Thermoanaerobaculia bacterium]
MTRRAPWRMLFLLLAVGIFETPAVAHPGSAIAVASDGRVFFVDTGGGVFSIERDGRMVRREGPAFHWFALDPAGLFRRTPWPSIPGAEFRSAGADPAVVLSSDFPVAIGSDGIFYYAERAGDGRKRIVGIDPAGKRSVRALLPRGEPELWINGLAAGPDGSLVYTENATVRRIDRSGRVSTLASRIEVPRCARIPFDEVDEVRPYLRGVAVETDGTVYVAAAACGAVLKVGRDGAASVVLRSSPPWSPTAVAVRSGEVYVLEYLHTPGDDRRQWLPRVRKIGRDGRVTALGGTTRRP